MKKILLFCVLSVFVLNIVAQTLDELWKVSIEDFQDKDYINAIEKLDIVIDALADYAPAYYNRGIAKMNLMDVKGACKDFSFAEKAGFKGNLKFTKWLCDEDYKLNLLKKQFYPNRELLTENNYRPQYTLKDTLRGALRPERTCYDVYFYDLSVRIHPVTKKIEGKNKIYCHILENTNRIQIDLFENLEIDSIRIDTIDLPYERIYNAIFIAVPDTLQAGTNQILTVKYHGKPRVAPNPPWDGGFTWKRDSRLHRWIGVSCEHLGASSWWPNKDHLTEKPDSMAINIEIPDRLFVVANGNLRDTIDLKDRFTRYEWFVHYPINNYNVTFYAGNFVNFSDTAYYNDKKLAVDYYVLPQNLDKAQEYFKQTVEVIEFYQEIYGPYPYWQDGFAQVESPFMGMEHQSAIAYGNAYGAENRAYHNKKYDPIIVHEAAHEWWGNAVAAEDMADVWIHEAFATYSEALFIENKFDYEEYLYEIRKNFNRVVNFWPMVENRDVNEQAFASSDIYMKGATMLHNLRCILNNDKLFFGLLRNFYNINRYKTVNTQDFINYANQYTGQNLSPFFHKFLYHEDPPVLEYSYKKNGNNILFYYQWIGVEPGFTMPFCIKTANNKNYRLTGTTEQKQIVLKNTNTFHFYNKITGFDGCEKNSFTYFWTKQKNMENYLTGNLTK